MTNLDYRNENGAQIGEEEIAGDGHALALHIHRSAANLKAIHMVGVEGFGVVTVLREDGAWPTYRWLEPRLDGSSAFVSAAYQGLAAAIDSHAINGNLFDGDGCPHGNDCDY